MKFSRRSR